MGMAAPAVRADLARTNLMPRLRRVEDHAVPVERLKSPRDIGRDLGQETGVRVAVRIEELLIPIELPHGDFPQNSHQLHGMAAEEPADLRTAAPIRGRLLDNDANRVNRVVRV